jgi:hypothetical protein
MFLDLGTSEEFSKELPEFLLFAVEFVGNVFLV